MPSMGSPNFHTEPHSWHIPSSEASHLLFMADVASLPPCMCGGVCGRGESLSRVSLCVFTRVRFPWRMVRLDGHGGSTGLTVSPEGISHGLIDVRWWIYRQTKLVNQWLLDNNGQAPVVPQRATCGAYLALRQEAIRLLELKRLAAAAQGGGSVPPGDRQKRPSKAKVSSSNRSRKISL
jgi:hypothetical protein